MRKYLFISVAVAGLAAGSTHVFAQAQNQNDGPPPPPPQMQLSDAQIEQYLAASPEIEAAMANVPQNSDAPDAKTIAKLEEIAKAHKFANYGELDEVAANVMLVLEGVDPQTKKYIGAEAELKKEIAALQANKQISAEDKKSELEELTQEQKSITPLKFKSNIDVVLKYYDKITAEQDQGQKQ